MGRLFRKIFFVILLAQFTTVAGVSGALWLRDVAYGHPFVEAGKAPGAFGPGGGGNPPHRPPPPPGPHIPWLPLGIGIAASLLFAVLLAWNFAKPIRGLRQALAAAARGNLDARVPAATAARRDELGDLGQDFDRMAAQLETLMEAQDRLLHDVSHELRSPLARLHAAVGLARQQPDKMAQMLDRIERESARMDALVGELLTLSRVSAGPVPALEPVDVVALVDDTVADAGFEAEPHERTVSFVAAAPATVLGRADLLHRAVENVVRNAIRHAPPRTSVRVHVDVDPAHRHVTIAVVDAGPGVPADELEAIFEPFVRGADGGDGHGLGLAIARSVVQRHHGSIRATNEPGGGLRVEIRLPLARATDDDRPAQGSGVRVAKDDVPAR